MIRIIHSVIIFLVFATSMMAQKAILPPSNSKTEMTHPIKSELKKNRASKNDVQTPYNYEAIKHFNIQNQFATPGIQPYFSKDNGSTPLYIAIDANKYQLKNKDILPKCIEFLNAASSILGVKDAQSFVHKNTSIDVKGHQHIRFDQEYKGILITNSQIILHSNENGLYLMNGKAHPTANIEIAIKPTLDEANIKEVVSTFLKKHHGTKFQKFTSGLKSKLGFEIEPWNIALELLSQEDELRLIYHVETHPNLGDFYTLYVDAHTGEVIHEHSNICGMHSPPPDGPIATQGPDLAGTTRTLQTYVIANKYYMIDASKTMFNAAQSNMPNEPSGVIWTIDAFNTAPQNDNFAYDHVVEIDSWSGRREAVSAHYNGEQAYLYFKNVHGRESVNGIGGDIVSFVNVADENGQSMGNAFWNGYAIFYGNGDDGFEALGKALDVAGHELTHGVIQNEANLEYYGESGALNESFADIFGAMIDRDDWLMGEDVVKTNTFPSGALRNLSDPHNGAATGDFGRGWQPRHVNEQYKGNEDNGGVHLNSGIPNYAYYKFATAVGKETAEKVYYAALKDYMTKSSKFIDQRIAVVQAAKDLYGSNVASAAEAAFDAVGIGAGTGGNYQEDININPGTDFVLYTDFNKTKLILADGNNNILADPLVNIGILSKPSVTDDGTEITFIGKDKKMYYVTINWTTGDVQTQILQADPMWRNVAFSRDGFRLAALTDKNDDQLYAYDFESGTENWFTLYNPTYTEGVSTGDVIYADVLEFDFSGNDVVYDAANEINSVSSGKIEYWDIGIINIWNEQLNSWSLGNISKLFSGIPDGVSIGNPTFSKNSPFILAIDYIAPDENLILGVNFETNAIGEIYKNSDIGFPNFSRTDEIVIFDARYDQGIDLGIIPLNSDKISAEQSSAVLFAEDRRWPVWFSNGQRQLNTGIFTVEADTESIIIRPNPVQDVLSISVDRFVKDESTLTVYDLTGKKLSSTLLDNVQKGDEITIEVGQYEAGVYFIKWQTVDGLMTSSFVKI